MGQSPLIAGGARHAGADDLSHRILIARWGTAVVAADGRCSAEVDDLSHRFKH
jgi:hypothetical protein